MVTFGSTGIVGAWNRDITRCQSSGRPGGVGAPGAGATGTKAIGTKAIGSNATSMAWSNWPKPTNEPAAWPRAWSVARSRTVSAPSTFDGRLADGEDAVRHAGSAPAL